MQLVLRISNYDQHIYNHVKMSDDGPSCDLFAATLFQGLTPNDSPCLLEIMVMGFGVCYALAKF
jgi:hypothetical protein